MDCSHQSSSRNEKVRQRRSHENTVGVLGQAPVASLRESEHALDWSRPPLIEAQQLLLW